MRSSKRYEGDTHHNQHRRYSKRITISPMMHTSAYWVGPQLSSVHVTSLLSLQRASVRRINLRDASALSSTTGAYTVNSTAGLRLFLVSSQNCDRKLSKRSWNTAQRTVVNNCCMDIFVHGADASGRTLTPRAPFPSLYRSSTKIKMMFNHPGWSYNRKHHVAVNTGTVVLRTTYRYQYGTIPVPVPVPYRRMGSRWQ